MRIALGVEYNGSRYHGWQRQQNAQSVQAFVEQAISSVANHPVGIFCAGRTDRGVHATAQVIHFDTEVTRPLHAWILGCNSLLPRDIAITWARQVADDFHARFKATERAYRYIVYNGYSRPALTDGLVTWWIKPLALQPMQAAAVSLVGKHDFSSFRAAECQAKSPVRTVHELALQASGELIYLDIRADGFLHHMVRNIAGVLLAIGSGEQPVQWAEQVLAAADRRAAAMTAPAAGLYLCDVRYPEQFEIPRSGYRPVYGCSRMAAPPAGER